MPGGGVQGCAGHAAPGALGALDVKMLDAHWAVSTRATIQLTRAFAARHYGRPGGRVIFMTSGQDLGPMTGEIAYAASKGALASLTRTDACAAAPGRLDTGSSSAYNGGMSHRAMQEATFLILTALADSAQHGYGIIMDVQQISGGRVKLRAGTLYTALDRLRADRLITVDREEVVEGRLRRYYRLTPEGAAVLAAEAARLQANAAAALTRLRLTLA
jgi:DNA-binding PadR family transcriptional regulator